MHGDESVLEQRLEKLSNRVMLVNELILLVVNIVDDGRVHHDCDNLANQVERDHSIL